MSHLGHRLSALIDGELSADERDRVLAHLAGCDPCRDEAAALRALKRRMHSLGEAMVDAALTGRLMAMDVPDGGASWAGRAPWRPRHGRPAAFYLTAGLIASAMVGLGTTAFMIGGDQEVPGPRVTPAVGTFLVQHASVIGDLPVTPVPAPASAAAAAAAAASTAGWPSAAPTAAAAGSAAAADGPAAATSNLASATSSPAQVPAQAPAPAGRVAAGTVARAAHPRSVGGGKPGTVS